MLSSMNWENFCCKGLDLEMLNFLDEEILGCEDLGLMVKSMNVEFFCCKDMGLVVKSVDW